MAVISMPAHEPWIVARWAFRELLNELVDELTFHADKELVTRGLALDGLHFSLMEPQQATRIGLALGKAAEDVRRSLARAVPPSTDQRDAEFADRLALLEASLRDLYGTRSEGEATV